MSVCAVLYSVCVVDKSKVGKKGKCLSLCMQGSPLGELVQWSDLMAVSNMV